MIITGLAIIVDLHINLHTIQQVHISYKQYLLFEKKNYDQYKKYYYDQYKKILL